MLCTVPFQASQKRKGRQVVTVETFLGAWYLKKEESWPFSNALFDTFKLSSFKEEPSPDRSDAASHVGAAVLAHVARSGWLDRCFPVAFAYYCEDWHLRSLRNVMYHRGVKALPQTCLRVTDNAESILLQINTCLACWIENVMRIFVAHIILSYQFDKME